MATLTLHPDAGAWLTKALTISATDSDPKGSLLRVEGNTTVNRPEDTSLPTFSQGFSRAGIIIETGLTSNAYTPGIFWKIPATATKPCSGIFLQETPAGPALLFGTSPAFSIGIGNYICVTPYGGLYVGPLSDMSPTIIPSIVVNSTSGIIIGHPHTASGGYTSLGLSISSPSGGYGRIQVIKSSGSAFGDLIVNPSGGNMAIGTTDPAGYRLRVAGTTYLNGLLRIGADLYLEGNARFVNFYMYIGTVSFGSEALRVTETGYTSLALRSAAKGADFIFLVRKILEAMGKPTSNVRVMCTGGIRNLMAAYVHMHNDTTMTLYGKVVNEPTNSYDVYDGNQTTWDGVLVFFA